LTAWATAGSRLAFVATVRNRQGLWVERFGSNQPRRVCPPVCGQNEEIDQFAAGPTGSWGCLERTEGNTEAYYSVDLMSAKGASRHVATAGGPTGADQPRSNSIPLIFGDGSLLGYLHLTVDGVMQLMRIAPSGKAQHIADLAGVTAPEAVAIAGTHLVLRHAGIASLYTTGGRPVATIAARAAADALTNDRVVIRTRDPAPRRLHIRGAACRLIPARRQRLDGGARGHGRYAVYLAANKTVRVVKLSTGTDRIVTRAGTGWFFNGLALQAPGAVVPLTKQQGKNFRVTLRFLPTAVLKATLAGR
jgi:hypothetical protein